MGRTMDSDIQVAYAGMRMAWWAVSERGREWVDAHEVMAREAPEGVECLIRFADPLIERALRDGLVVKAGDVEVSLC